MTHSFPTRRSSELAALAICLLATACTGKAPPHEADTNTTPTPAPQRAGQPVEPIKTAGHIAAARVAAITRSRGKAAAGSGHSPRRSRSEEHTSELQSLMRISYAVFCLKKTK